MILVMYLQPRTVCRCDLVPSSYIEQAHFRADCCTIDGSSNYVTCRGVNVKNVSRCGARCPQRFGQYDLVSDQRRCVSQALERARLWYQTRSIFLSIEWVRQASKNSITLFTTE